MKHADKQIKQFITVLNSINNIGKQIIYLDNINYLKNRNSEYLNTLSVPF